ncbi:MAG: cyclic nucleotide-binding and patatin-like phospholipase domain-containing protein [Actinomycetota bacterium]
MSGGTEDVLNLDRLVGDSDRRRIEDGAVLVSEGDVGDGVFVVVDGALEVSRAADGGEIVVATLTQGMLAGEVTHTMGGRRTATLRAHGPTEVVEIERDVFYRWLDAHPDQADAVAEAARQRRNRTRAAATLTRFFGLDEATLIDEIVDEITWVTMRPGEVLFEQGDPSDAAYLVVAGRLRMRSIDAHGEIDLDVELGRGEIVGELGIMHESARSASARVVRNTTLARLSRESFELLNERNPSLALRVSMQIIERLRRQHTPDRRARVIAVAVTASIGPEELGQIAAEIGRFGTTVVVDEAELQLRVRDLDGPGGADRAAEFIHEADVNSDYVLLVDYGAPTEWASAIAQQCDRFVGVISADPTADEASQMQRHLDALPIEVRDSSWLVRIHPPSATNPSDTAGVRARFGVAEVHNVRAGVDEHIDRIARLMSGNGRGVILAGGGAKGMAHVGALAALRDAGVTYDRVGGTSMGALMAALAAQDVDDAVMAQTVEREFHKGIFQPTVPLVGLITAEKIAESLVRQFGGRDVSDTWIPMYAVSTNLSRSSLAIHRDGPMPRALRASISLPVIMPPVPIDGDLHVDGAVLDNLPVAAMVGDASVGTTIAIDVSPTAGPTASTDYGLHVSGLSALWRRIRRRPALHPGIGTTLQSSLLIGSTRAHNEAVDLVDCFVQLDVSEVGLLQYEDHHAVIDGGRRNTAPVVAAWLADRADPT